MNGIRATLGQSTVPPLQFYILISELNKSDSFVILFEFVYQPATLQKADVCCGGYNNRTVISVTRFETSLQFTTHAFWNLAMADVFIKLGCG